MRRHDGVRWRPEAFGAVAYIPDTDRFVALDQSAAAAFADLGSDTVPVNDDQSIMMQQLAAAGVVDSWPTAVQQHAHARRLVGDFASVPEVATPLVVNVFATAWCPLSCRYCFADDLMQQYRTEESEYDVELTAQTAIAVPALVAVVSGGDPLMHPMRSRRLISELAPEKAIVLDTSGTGDITPLVEILGEVKGHLRVSLDSAEAGVHDWLRPINRRLFPNEVSSHKAAWVTIRRAVAEGIRTTIQTVITRANQSEAELIAIARQLVDAGVRGWVLHMAVAAGKAAEGRSHYLLPTKSAMSVLERVSARLEAEDEFQSLSVRVTASHKTPNAVLLVSNRGELYVESRLTGKKRIAISASNPEEVVRLFQTNVDLSAHAVRYFGEKGSI